MKTIALCTLALAAVLTGGCSVMPDRPARPDLYDLGPLPALAATAQMAETAATTATTTRIDPRPPLLWGGVSAPRTLEGTAIIYRLLYVHDGQQPRPYAHARWAEPPAQLLGDRLRAALAASRVVLDADAGLTRAPELRIELDDFSQPFDAPAQSFGVVRLRATRIAPLDADEADDARRIAQRSFAARIPAPGNDAASGAQALRAATDQLISQIVAWLDDRD